MCQKIRPSKKFHSGLVGIWSFALFFCTPTFADWAHLTSIKGTKIYIQANRSEVPARNTIYVLYDYGEKGEYDDLSSIYLYETNCKTGYVRAVRFQYFEGEMGRGRIVRNGVDGTSWECPKKDSLMQAIADISCKSDSQNRTKTTTELLNEQYLDTRCFNN